MQYHSFSFLTIILALMALGFNLSQCLLSNCKPSTGINIKSCSNTNQSGPSAAQFQTKKRCLRCNTLYLDTHNSPTACSFHGHTTERKGLLALAPPHQGIDGEWSDRSGVIVYRWNEKNNRPNTGSANGKKKWSCCAEYGENAPPCRRG
ncbi:uncharacterized protein LOC121240215 [Juglans microcarpa x Juglans regia]|uniref:uncharacterized protein LOC121240215 n=1 Tax=Juglans microcarpa x Juglans regia TaxID=2249226 RepID=UPI001B7DD07B|nr:uncharacterized protein LOC121240215 [Juglans microcarpa x Juglans regia]